LSAPPDPDIMDLLRLSLLSVGLALAAAQKCDVCHLHYYHKV